MNITNHDLRLYVDGWFKKSSNRGCIAWIIRNKYGDLLDEQTALVSNCDTRIVELQKKIGAVTEFLYVAKPKNPAAALLREQPCKSPRYRWSFKARHYDGAVR